MKREYISPELETITLTMKDVILASIIDHDESMASSGVVIIDDEELEEP